MINRRTDKFPKSGALAVLKRTRKKLGASDSKNSCHSRTRNNWLRLAWFSTGCQRRQWRV